MSNIEYWFDGNINLAFLVAQGKSYKTSNKNNNKKKKKLSFVDCSVWKIGLKGASKKGP